MDMSEKKGMDIKMRNNEINRFIYGAGEYGKKLQEYFSCMGIVIDSFIQTEEPDNKVIDTIPVITIKNFKEKQKGKSVIYIAIANEKIIREIKENLYSLREQGSIVVYDAKSFIEDNLRDNCNVELQGSKECIICGESVRDFLPAGRKQELFDNYHVIGGGYRKNAICPCCGSLDRERWFYYILKNKLKVLEMTGRILHFAPERRVSKLIGINEKIDYYTGDIAHGRAMHITDIVDIQYKNDTFDYVICNHVMEHIVDEKKAVSEIKRVLKPNGKWIFSFPICIDMETYEDEEMITPSQRLEAYGQEDHVRLYGKDFEERFQNYGLKLEIYSPQKELDELMIEKWGLIEDDIIIVATNNKYNC